MRVRKFIRCNAISTLLIDISKKNYSKAKPSDFQHEITGDHSILSNKSVRAIPTATGVNRTKSL